LASVECPDLRRRRLIVSPRRFVALKDSIAIALLVLSVSPAIAGDRTDKAEFCLAFARGNAASETLLTNNFVVGF